MGSADSSTPSPKESQAGTPRSDPRQLFEVLYQQLKALAARHLASERAGHTLQATALVHEAYLRIVDEPQLREKGREFFYVSAATAMRRILVEHARARNAAIRGGGRQRVTIATALANAESRDADEQERRAAEAIDVEALDRALTKLGATGERGGQQAKVVELKYFAGVTDDDAAGILGVSVRTVKNYWSFSKAFLRKELESQGTP